MTDYATVAFFVLNPFIPPLNNEMSATVEIPKQDTKLCVTPMPKRHQKECYEHAKMISRFLRGAGLEDYKFEMKQRYPLSRNHQGKTKMSLVLEEGDHSNNCVVTISSAGENCLPYVIAHPKMTAHEVHQRLFKAMGEKDKIHLS